MESWAGARVVITGVCGTVGRQLLEAVAADGPAELIGLDNNESELFFLQEAYQDDDAVRFFVADIRDRFALLQRFSGADIVLHSAALKHVILCEESPREPIQTNVLGTQNVIDAAIEAGVGRVLFTSSDKAVNPTNVMGTSKLMGERLMTAANATRQGRRTVFASTRFGNVLGSRGSVIPIFRRQIAAGGPVTLTDPEMTRFIMTLAEAVQLVMETALLARGGEVFVTKMAAVRIVDLVAVMIEEIAPLHGRDPAAIAVTTIGKKPGEKLYEELINDEETRRVVELERYFIVLPAFRSVYGDVAYDYAGILQRQIRDPYNSALAPTMSRDDLRHYLRANRLLEAE